MLYIIVIVVFRNNGSDKYNTLHIVVLFRLEAHRNKNNKNNNMCIRRHCIMTKTLQRSTLNDVRNNAVSDIIFRDVNLRNLGDC